MVGFYVVTLARFPDGRVGVVSHDTLPEGEAVPQPAPDGLSSVLVPPSASRPTPEAVAEALRRYSAALSA